MADLMSEQKRYLAARRAECATRPELNRAQVAEYDTYLALLASSRDAGDYADRIARSGDMFSISQAEQLDRWENLAAVKRLFGDLAGAAAQTSCRDAAAAASSHMDLYNRMQAATPAANAAVAKAQQAVQHVSTLVQAIVGWKVRCTAKKAVAAAAVRKAWQNLRAVDPGVTWEKVRAYPPYRSVIIFDDARLATLEKWFDEAVA